MSPSGPAFLERNGPFTEQQFKRRENFVLSWNPKEITSRSPYVSTVDSMNMGSSAYPATPFFGIGIFGINKFEVYGPGKSDSETLRNTCFKLNP